MKKQLLTSLLAVSCALLNAQSTQTIWTMTNGGGANNGGTIVKMNPDGTGLTPVYDFLYATGDVPYGNLMQASDGNIYATTEDGGPSGSCVIFRFDPQTNTYTDVHDFWGSDGYIPMSGLTEYNGNLYGVTIDGGAHNFGVIYRYNLSTGVYTDVFDFNTPLGSDPYAALILVNGKLYGTTQSGGSGNAGVIFQFDPSNNSYTILHHLTPSTEGAMSHGSLLHASDGKLYGTTYGGGANGSGTIFSYDITAGTFNTLHTFTDPSGGDPLSGLTEVNGVLFGTANLGGAHASGVVYSYNLNTSTYTDLHDFNGPDGTFPAGDLFLSSNGLLFGTVSQGGAGGYGTVFSLDPANNTFTTVHQFDGTDGSGSQSGFAWITTPTGVNDPTMNENAVSVFPNPSHDVISISSSITGDVSFTVLNSLGQQVMEWNENTSMNYSRQIDIADLDAGIYFLEMKTADGMVTKKFVKE